MGGKAKGDIRRGEGKCKEGWVGRPGDMKGGSGGKGTWKEGWVERRKDM